MLRKSRNFHPAVATPQAKNRAMTAKTCGHFCVYYLARKFAGDSMRGILAEFSEDERRNDDIVYDFVDRIAVT